VTAKADATSIAALQLKIRIFTAVTFGALAVAAVGVALVLLLGQFARIAHFASLLGSMAGAAALLLSRGRGQRLVSASHMRYLIVAVVHLVLIFWAAEGGFLKELSA